MSDIEFQDVDPRQALTGFKKTRKHVATGRKVGAGAHDVYEAVRGKRSNKRRKRVWEKQAFKDSVTAAALLGIIGGGYKLSKSKMFLSNMEKYKNFISKVGKIYLEKLDERIELDAAAALGLTGKDKDNWRTSRPTGSSVRVHIGKKARDRREKKWHEKTEWKDRFIKAGAATSIAAGLVALAGARGNLSKIKQLKEVAKRADDSADATRKANMARNAAEDATRAAQGKTEQAKRVLRKTSEGKGPVARSAGRAINRRRQRKTRNKQKFDPNSKMNRSVEKGFIEGEKRNKQKPA